MAAPTTPTFGSNPGNAKDVGNSPYDGVTGASNQNYENAPDAGPMGDGDDSQPNQPPGYFTRIGDSIDGPGDDDTLDLGTGQNPGNAKPVGQSPFDGVTGASNQNYEYAPDSDPMGDGDDSQPNQPPGAFKNIQSDASDPLVFGGSTATTSGNGQPDLEQLGNSDLYGRPVRNNPQDDEILNIGAGITDEDDDDFTTLLIGTGNN